MNKYQEALDRLNTINMVNFIGDKELTKHKDNDIKILQELVDKETPMKVGSYTGSKWKFRGKFICPRCNKILLIRNLPIRCDSCGQKLDFGGE